MVTTGHHQEQQIPITSRFVPADVFEIDSILVPPGPWIYIRNSNYNSIQTVKVANQSADLKLLRLPVLYFGRPKPAILPPPLFPQI